MRKKIMNTKDHLADDVYVNFTPCEVVLTTENGVKTLNRIVIRHAAFHHLIYKYKSYCKNYAQGGEQCSET